MTYDTPGDVTHCITECPFYEKKDKYWREAEKNQYVGVCKKHSRKVSDIFCGCRAVSNGATNFWNFTEDSWINK